MGDTRPLGDSVLAAYRFFDAVNERDFDALHALITDDVTMRLTDGREWSGPDGAREFLDVARELELRLIPLHRGEHAEERDGVVHVEMRVRELIRYDDIERLADFDVRGGHIAAFALRPVETL
jgi:ketosteroid isomerase-like protein